MAPSGTFWFRKLESEWVKGSLTDLFLDNRCQLLHVRLIIIHDGE